MESLSQLGIGYSVPRIAPFPSHRNLQNPRRHGRPTVFTCSASKWADRLLGDFNFAGDVSSSDQYQSTATLSPPSPPSLAPPTERHVSIPLDFYHVLGAETHFLGDGIRRAYESRVSKPPQYGFSQDALLSRRQILMAACETLVTSGSRREYNQNLVEDEEGTVFTQVPWDKVSLSLTFSIYIFSYLVCISILYIDLIS